MSRLQTHFDRSMEKIDRQIAKAKQADKSKYLFARMLISFRMDREYSQADAASAGGISQRMVSDWETAKRSPLIAELPLVAKAYGTTAREILRKMLTFNTEKV